MNHKNVFELTLHNRDNKFPAYTDEDGNVAGVINRTLRVEPFECHNHSAGLKVDIIEEYVPDGGSRYKTLRVLESFIISQDEVENETLNGNDDDTVNVALLECSGLIREIYVGELTGGAGCAAVRKVLRAWCKRIVIKYVPAKYLWIGDL